MLAKEEEEELQGGCRVLGGEGGGGEITGWVQDPYRRRKSRRRSNRIGEEEQLEIITG